MDPVKEKERYSVSFQHCHGVNVQYKKKKIKKTEHLTFYISILHFKIHFDLTLIHDKHRGRHSRVLFLPDLRVSRQSIIREKLQPVNVL